MWKTKLCLNVHSGFEIEPMSQIKVFHDAGFEGFFISWQRGMDVAEIAEFAASIGMIFQSIHAPFGKAAIMWENSSDAKDAIAELMECVDVCAENKVPIMVCHTIIGFDKHTPTKAGIENYRKVVLYAKEKGVKIAFENTEGEEYLAAIMDAFSEHENVGFCWDTGHEMCYNHSKDMLALYGDRLIATHINDNLGIRDFGGEITFIDDLHLLPFDGVADWQNIVHRLNRSGYNDILTFELKIQNNPGRHEHDDQHKMSFEEYIAEVYKRACRVATLKMRDSGEI